MSLLKNKYFYINIALAAILFVAIVITVLLSLKLFTRHDEAIILPSFEGQPLETLRQFTKEHKLQYVIIDSVYNDDLAPGTIVLQDPYPKATVKKGRKIYVSVVSILPEMVVMPNVVNLSVRQAVSMIYSNELCIEKLVFKSGFDKNAVQKQLFENKSVEAGTKLVKHAPITLEVSSGSQDGFGKVPSLKGLTKEEAIQKIYQYSFNVGKISGADSKTARVTSQSPGATSSQSLGHKISFSLDGSIALEDTDIDTMLIDSTMLDGNTEFDNIEKGLTEEEF